VRSNDAQVAYLVDSFSSSPLPVVADGAYNETDVYWNNVVTRASTSLRNGTLVELRRDVTQLANTSFTVYGTSVSSDIVRRSDRAQINWAGDSSHPGFHALYLLLNQSEWGLPALSARGGGVAFDVYGDGSGRELRFSFMAPETKYFAWPLQTLHITWTGWNRVFLPLSNFTQIGSAQWSDVASLWIWQEVPSTPSPSEIGIRNFAEDFSPRLSIFSPTCDGSSLQRVGCTQRTGLELVWKRESQVSYAVSARSSDPFFLRINNAYDPGWRALANATNLQHLEIDSYANGFYVPASPHGIDINITFKGQDLFVIGTYTSLALFALMVIIILRSTIRSGLGRLKRFGSHENLCQYKSEALCSITRPRSRSTC